MDMSLPRNTSLLEKWLEDMPNSNSDVNVKKERKDVFRDFFASNVTTNTNSALNGLSMNAMQSNTTSGLNHNNNNNNNTAANETKTKSDESDDKSSTVDSSSVDGVFGWQTVNDIPLPVILREDERLVAVRIVESKVIAKFSSFLPWNVFSCINIKSYYMTENEAKLLNDINVNHCEYQFGCDPFTTKDVVVCLPDVNTLYKFLNTSKDIFHFGLSKSGIDWLGFINISGSHIIPYIAKKANNAKGVQKYVPQSLVQQTVLLVKVEKAEMTEWDASYLRMLCAYAALEHIHIQSNDSLCLLNDLKWDPSLCPLHIEECSPPNSKLIHHKYNVNKDYSFSSAPQVSARTSAPAMDESNNWLMASQASTSSNALRSLHQITRADINGFALKAINLKPYSTQQAVFVSDVVTKMFRGVSILTAHYI
ncbi:unnamed protein product, partial [Medioppia subpectinata]